MRRRPSTTGRHPLMDAGRWQQCGRFDGKTQPCLCWFAQQQLKLHAAGEWPGGEAAVLADYAEMTQRHDCAAPFDWSAI